MPVTSLDDERIQMFADDDSANDTSALYIPFDAEVVILFSSSGSGPVELNQTALQLLLTDQARDVIIQYRGEELLLEVYSPADCAYGEDDFYCTTGGGTVPPEHNPIQSENGGDVWVLDYWQENNELIHTYFQLRFDSGEYIIVTRYVDLDDDRRDVPGMSPGPTGLVIFDHDFDESGVVSNLPWGGPFTGAFFPGSGIPTPSSQTKGLRIIPRDYLSPTSWSLSIELT